jgi:hypothetical protein
MALGRMVLPMAAQGSQRCCCARHDTCRTSGFWTLAAVVSALLCVRSRRGISAGKPVGLCIAVQEALTVSDAQDLDLQNWHERQMGALSHHSGLVLDDLSFGEAARASVLQRSVDMCARPDLAADVRRAYRRLWGRADKGGFEFGWPAGVALPGFFQGTAGIGYQLLRRDFDVTLPDVFAFS